MEFRQPIPFLTPTANRKRRAASPETLSSSLSHFPLHQDKKRRPNLTNGFSNLSLTPDGQLVAPRQPCNHDSDEGDEGLGPSNYPKSNNNDLKVEVLPDTLVGSTHSHHCQPNCQAQYRPPIHPSSSSSTSPTTSNDESRDLDATYTGNIHRSRHHTTTAQQADEVVQPDGEGKPGGFGLSVEDVTEFPIPLRGRRPREEDSLSDTEPFGKRPRIDEADVDMGAESIEEIPRSEAIDLGRGRKTIWYEPEKDRIVITSLSDSESRSSRSPSPEMDGRRLSQPGQNGFIISPSLLTHLIRTRREYDFKSPLEDLLRNNKKTLTLYRPLKNLPDKWPESVVKAWEEVQPHELSGRFEEIADDEDFTTNTNPETPREDEMMEIEDPTSYQTDNMSRNGLSAASNGDIQERNGDVDMAIDGE
nr:hypothetical protein L204_04771 [Cryptococcus depauperatus CBS 7855]